MYFSSPPPFKVPFRPLSGTEFKPWHVVLCVGLTPRFSYSFQDLDFPSRFLRAGHVSPPVFVSGVVFSFFLEQQKQKKSSWQGGSKTTLTQQNTLRCFREKVLFAPRSYVCVCVSGGFFPLFARDCFTPVNIYLFICIYKMGLFYSPLPFHSSYFSPRLLVVSRPGPLSSRVVFLRDFSYSILFFLRGSCWLHLSRGLCTP